MVAKKRTAMDMRDQTVAFRGGETSESVWRARECSGASEWSSTCEGAKKNRSLHCIQRKYFAQRQRGEWRWAGEEECERGGEAMKEFFPLFFFRFFLLMIILELVFWVWAFYLFIEWLGKISDDGKNWVALGNK